MGMGMELGHLAGLRQLARLAAMQAVLAAERQDSTEATSVLLDGLALARSLDAEPSMVSQLVRLACAGIIVDAAQQVINRTTLSDSDLAQLQAGLAALDSPEPMIGAYEGEKWMLALPMPPIETMLPNSPPRAAEERNPPIPPGGPIELSEKERKAIEERQQAELQKAQAEHLADVNACLEKLRRPIYETFQFVKLPEDFDINNPAESLGSRSQNPMHRAITAYIRCTASVRVAQAALAVERFRVRNQGLPDSINDLVPSYLPRDAAMDPFTDESLQFQIGDDRFVVYSAGDPLINDKIQRENPDAPSGISFTVVF
jgi:hypothetical protein